MRRTVVAAGMAAFLGCFAGLCSIFALVATIGEAWHEHIQSRWPEATATIERCGLDLRYSNGGANGYSMWRLECRIGYRVGPDEVETRIHASYRRRRSEGYPEPMRQWVDDHPAGAALLVRYDPADVKTAIPAEDYLPNGGPRTPDNLKVLWAFSVACASLLAIAWLLRRRAGRLSTEAR